jgi:hypothetical protein
MPQIFAAKHHMFIETYCKTGKEKVLNRSVEAFGMYRTGVIFSAYIVVKPVPSLRNDI